MKDNNDLSESLEDYLETILSLEETVKVARAKDIAEKMGVQRGSVTSALKNLSEKKLINYEPYSFVTLTSKGTKIAKDIASRHSMLKGFLIDILHIDEETAESTACKMEHAIDKKTLERLTLFFEFMHTCPRAGKEWINSFMEFCTTNEKTKSKCKKCLDEVKEKIEKQF